MGKLIAIIILSILLMFVLTYIHVTFVYIIIKAYKTDWRVIKGKTIFYSTCIILCHLVEMGIIIYSCIVPVIVEVV